jgi:hydroxypyruvate isomerase
MIMPSKRCKCLIRMAIAYQGHGIGYHRQQAIPRPGSIMPRFSANLSMLFTEHAPLDRLTAARDAGFGGIEFQFPYDLDVDLLHRVKERTGVGVSVINVPVGDMLEGGPGLASIPGREATFRDAVALARRYAEALQPANVNVLAGRPPPEADRTRCRETLVANLRHAADVMGEIGVKLVVEAINTRDVPGFFLTRSVEAVAILDLAGHPNLVLEHDLYHMQIMEGDLVPTLERLLPRIGHVQFADTPGRHEPGTGEINFPFVFAALDRLGYDRWTAAEYTPTGPTEDSLGWLKPYL